jgi:probable lipoprotein NlpC
MQALPIAAYAGLVGKPYADNGRGPDAFDCLGLAIAVERAAGFAIPDYASTPEEFAAQHRDGLLGPCTRIERAVPGAVVLMRDFPDGQHLGVMIDRWRMIHCAKYTGSVVIEQLTRSPFRSRILGFYFPEVRA